MKNDWSPPSLEKSAQKKCVCINTLSRSFDGNNSVNYAVKQDNLRKDRIQLLMEYSFEICQMFGKVYLTRDQQGTALILYPEKKKTTLKSIFLDIKLAVSSIGISRVKKIVSRDNRIKSLHPKTAICYLWFIGVNPESQGKGIGKRLMQEIIQDHDQLPIYLETSVPQNVGFYESLGFHVYSELMFDHKLFLMKRPADP